MMKAANTYLLIIFMAWSALACSTASTSTPPGQGKSSLAGDYHYVSYDKQGAKVVEGTLSITSVEQKRISTKEVTQVEGSWQLNKAGNQEHIGEQAGSGKLTGSILDGELYINLNPNISDANVILQGRVEGKQYKGKWSFRGYAGTISEGTFEAVKQ